MQNYINAINQSDKNDFAIWYDDQFKQQVDELTIFHETLSLIDGYGSKLFGNERASETPYLVANDIRELMDERDTLNDYKIFGFWGHGVNSYAVVYAWFHKNIRVYLRLPYGGVYTDNKKAARLLPNIIKQTDTLVQHAIRDNASLSFYCLMGTGSFRYFGSEFLECEFDHIYRHHSTLFSSIADLIKAG